MIDAFILCDFDNPLSMRYLDLSLESFKAVEDIVNITPLQCDTPATTPIHHAEIRRPFKPEDYDKLPSWIEFDNPDDYLRERHIGGAFYDPPAYGAIAYSHLKLIKRIADGEPIAIMEHDAALINEDSFRAMIDDHWNQVDLFMPGTCCEFYGMSQTLAKATYDHMYDLPAYPGEHYSGWFGVMSNKHLRYCPEADLFLAPSKVHPTIDKQFLAPTCWHAENGKGYESYEPACKQFMFRDKNKRLMNTNGHTPSADEDIMDHMEGDRHVTGVSYDRCFVFLDE